MKKVVILFFFTILSLNVIACKSTTKISDMPTTAIISLNNTITVSGNGVIIDHNVVNIISSGTFQLSGHLENGYIHVNTVGNVNLILNGVSINHELGPALLITNANQVNIKLEDQTVNTFSDAENDTQYDGAIFSKNRIVIEGNGTLIINGNDNEGVSSDTEIIINSGTIKINSKDDGLNAKNNITIHGGYVYIVANGDGVDSNGSILITGGTLISLGSIKNNNGGLDVTMSYTITGGTVIATGRKIAGPSHNSTQPSIYLSLDEKRSSGTIIHIEKDGVEQLTFAPLAHFRVFYYSSPFLKQDESYQIDVGGTSTGTHKDGLYTGGIYTKGPYKATLHASITPIGMDYPE